MHMDKVSIIIPIYNVEDYLEECIVSVINQTYKNIEIILVDDGSTDQSPFICDEYKEKDSRIKVIHKTNGGLSDARNAGIEIATGDYLFMLDSDDYIDLNTIKVMLERLKDTQSDMVICNIQYVDEYGKVLKGYDPVRNFKIKNEIWNVDQFWKCCYKRGHIVCTVQWNKLYKRSLFDDVRYPKGKLREDEFIIDKIVEKCQRIACVNNSFHYYRQRQSSIMGNAYSIKQLDIIEAYIEREKNLVRCHKLKYARKTLTRAILFLEWFSIGMANEQQIIKRYDYLKGQVCDECDSILKMRFNLLFYVEVSLYKNGLLPYKLVRSLFWKLNHLLSK